MNNMKEKEWKQLACEYEHLLYLACAVLNNILPDIEYTWGDEEKMKKHIRIGKEIINTFFNNPQ